jgi:Domain of unknown function (DUF4296)
MNRRLLCVALILFLLSCQDKKKGEVKGVLNKTELAAFLVEVYMGEARIDNLNLSKDSAIKLFLPYEEKLKEKFHLSDSMLKITYNYYLAHPKEMETVYDAVIDTLSLHEQRGK